MKIVRRFTWCMTSLSLCISLSGCLFFSSTTAPDTTAVQPTPLSATTTSTTTDATGAVKQQKTTTYSAP
jgi:hypothetical protein